MDWQWWIERVTPTASWIRWMQSISWSDWLQTAVSAAAIFLGPRAATSVLERLRYTFEATCMPVDADESGQAQRWNVWLANRRKSMRALEASIYPKRPGNRVVFARAGQENDGGVFLRKLVVEECVLKLDVSRFAAKRRLGLAITFLTPDIPQIHSPEVGVYKLVDYGFSTEAARAHSAAASHTRLMMLMLQFVAATALIVGRLIYLGSHA